MNTRTTLIITTYNWTDALYMVLKSVQIQSVSPTEVIIADDGSTEETKKLIDEFRKILGFPLIHLWQEDRGFRKSIILNKAISQAMGDYIIQVDGDVILHKHFIKDHLKYAKDNTFLLGSRVTLKEDRSKEILKSKKNKVNYFSKGIKKRNRLVRLPFFSNFLKAKNENTGKLRGCNISYWKKDAIAINGYNEEFKGWGGEDYEFGQRLINKGVFAKRIKHAAIQCHFYHKQAPKGNKTTGDNLIKNAVQNKIYFTDKGIVKK
jgi:glycosyltransferase involved in cell wall biosynthesis